MAPVIRGNSLYKTATSTNYGDSKTQATSYGGNLAAIENSSENAFLVSTYAPDYWCLYAGGKGNPRRWENDTEMSFTNWQPGQDVWGYNVKLILKTTFASWETGWFQGGWQGTPYYDVVDPYGAKRSVGDPTASAYLIEIPLTSSITFSTTPKEGAGVFTTSFNLSAGNQTTGNLAEGAPVWWKVTGITADDLVSGYLTGTGTIANGKLDIQHSLKVDGDTGETLEVSVYSDADRTQQIGTTKSAVVLEAPVVRGNSLYTIVDGPSWTQAEANSVKLGGHLVTIESKDENVFIVNYLIPVTRSSVDGSWIGLTDKDKEGQWQWSNGSDSAYRNWNRYQPDNMGDQDYGVIYQFNSGDWDDAESPFRAGVESLSGIAEIPLTSSITFSTTPKEGTGVFTTSINLSAGTQTTGNLAEGAPVWWKVTGITAEDLSSGALTGTGTITNGKLDIQHSLKADADTGEKFEVSLYSDASHLSVSLDSSYADYNARYAECAGYDGLINSPEEIFIAKESLLLFDEGTGEKLIDSLWSNMRWESLKEYQIGATYSKAILEGAVPVVRGNSLYTIVDGPSWTQAEANSVKLGGHLAQVSSLDENDFLANRFDKNSRIKSNSEYVAWIGITYDFSRNEWTDVNGQKQQFFNWYPGQPDQNKKDLGRVETSIILSGSTSGSVGVWDDSQELQKSQYLRNGIAETYFIRRGDSAYVIVQGPTWEEAEANAVKLGGHLVTINDAAENDWIRSSFFSPTGEWESSKWIGASDATQEGKWYWSSSDTSSYANWALGEPTNTQHSIIGEDYAAFHPNGLWFDIPNSPIEASSLAWFANGLTGIAEIKLAPNNTSTGTPTLSGSLKSGQVITVDRTPLQDADNFTGYTPTYNYSFEVSNDNGTTWTKLTTIDATDNTTTYTLTTAEVGKQVRGVVSYLDGYGTNESVATAGSINVIAPSNTAPTVVQTLTGSSKVGRVLTADKSTIMDPDGIPTSVSYGWEVSTNGTTWTKLTSVDATDNNSTYSLTGAELGKTVRSVISYTDGLGANETVSSAPTSVVLVGAKPTGISLSKSTIAENVGPNVAVAKLSSVDLDTDDAYTYTLVTGSGATDNSRFSIAGDQLVIAGNPDFETKNSYSIRLRTTDLGGLTVDKSFTLKVTNVNEAPIAISLSDSDFLENIAAGSVIASLSSIDLDKDTTFTYSLTPNSPRATFADNQFFSIVNDQLKINVPANFEQKDSYTISVRSTDAGKLFYDQVFTLVVQDVDEAPTDISIIGTGIDEGAAVGSIVGSLVSTDQDESSSDFTYELVAGNKPNNNDQFEIVGDQLKAKSVFNFETKSSYVVNVRTTDEAGLTFTKSITIRVNNVNENPTDLTVSVTTFNENLAIGTTVSTLGVLDPDKGDTYSYTFVSGEGDKDNQAFLIAGNALKVNVATNFEIQKSYAVRLRVTDQGGLFFDKAVVLVVNNQVEKVTSGVSTTLAPDKDTLELTGTRNIAGIGNQFDNTIVGNSGRNKLTGGMGKDILTGGTGIDTFFYNDLKESLLSGFDVITDFAAGERINIGTSLFEGDDLIASTGKASALTGIAIGSVLTNTTFLANNAAGFTVEGRTGTFLALNDGRDGFQEESDALIHLSNYTIGSKTPISII